MSTISKTIHISDTVHGSIPISYLEKIIMSTRMVASTKSETYKDHNEQAGTLSTFIH